jgi:hypothetical protein
MIKLVNYIVNELTLHKFEDAITIGSGAHDRIDQLLATIITRETHKGSYQRVRIQTKAASRHLWLRQLRLQEKDITDEQ